MKKFVTLFLTLALCMGLAVPAFAASTETIDGVTITNVVRKETKTVPFIEYDENYNQSIVEKTITIYYIADGAVITTNDGFAGNYGYTLFNGAYEQGAGGQIGEIGTWTEHQSNSWADFYELIADTTDQQVFYAFDGTEVIGEVVSSETPSETPADPEPTTPVQPEQPSEPVEEPEPEPEIVAGFNDVPTTAWYAGYVQTVVDKDLFAGVGEGTFAPESSMTYAQFLTVLYKFSGDQLPASQGAWYQGYVDWAENAGLVPAEMAGFNPDASITRQDMAALFGNFLDAYDHSAQPVTDEEPSFADAGSIAGYAADGVTLCYQMGLMSGNDDGTFAPAATATRAQVAVTMTQMARVMGW